MSDRTDDRTSIQMSPAAEHVPPRGAALDGDLTPFPAEDDPSRSEDSPQRLAIPTWLKAAAWLAAAVVLAVFGYREALGHAAPAAETTVGALPVAPLPLGSATETDTLGRRVPVEPRPQSAPPGSPNLPAPVVEGASAPGAPTASAAADPAPSQAITPDGKIILNLATEVELRKLPGIGKARAHAILAERDRLGKFRRIEELLRVKGIGPKRLRALRPKVLLDPA